MSLDCCEVRTKPELKQAMKDGAKKITARGELAEKIHQTEGISKLSKPALVVLAAALATSPFTGGASAIVGFAGISATTGLAIVAIVAVAFLGLNTTLALTNGYDRKFTAKADGVGEASIEMTKRN